MLSSIKLKFSDNRSLNLPAEGITIFVGPNNSGKSLLLREIESAFITHPFPANTHLLEDYEVRWVDEESVEFEIRKYEQPSEKLELGKVSIGRLNPHGGRETGQLNVEQIKKIARSKSNKHWWATQFLKWGVLRLDGRSRFNLTNDQSGGDLLDPPQNVLAHLFQNDSSRLRVRDLVHEAFGMTFAIDPTNLGQLRIKMSREGALKDEQSLNGTARGYFARAMHIKECSDGVQAFTGIITAVMSGNFHTILVDEPEAFLHPPLAKKLGASLASLATERQGSLFAATHSADFLMGCVQSSKAVRVVRLAHNEGKSAGRSVDPAELERLFREPLMRSANAISGLFYDGVVVAESDNDRAFYAEIMHRISSIQKDCPSILFINAQNKQTIKNIIGPLRKFGVPAAAITDIDILKDGGKTWTEWLCSAHIPNALHGGFATQRSEILAKFQGTGKEMKSAGGVHALADEEKRAAEQLLETLAEYGIFVVPHGELEHWLPDLSVPGKKTDWTIGMLERLGSDPADPDYVQPSAGDVWGFMQRIVEWVNRANRKGVP